MASTLRLTRESLAEGARVLHRADPRLGRWIRLIDSNGGVGLRRQRHQFGALCRSIIAQQLAAKAAKSISARFVALFEPDRNPSPEKLLALPDDRLRACGLSRSKLDYLQSLAREFDVGCLRQVRLGALADDEVVELLTRVRGIGVWTAEMFLIFSLGRRDVFSVGDLALRTGVQRVVGRELDHREIARVAERWSPYRSVASLYLWKISHWDGEEP